MAKKLTTEEFIEKARNIHGNKYDYSKVEYVNNYTKVCIICPEHDEFYQAPNNHLKGQGCPKCRNAYFSRLNGIGYDTFVERARKIHGNKYDYSKVNYVNNHTNVCIVCPKHGEFWQSPSTHLNGYGCHECAKDKRITSFNFTEKAKQVHGNKYDYSKVNYINCETKVCIICPEHGEFWQTPNNHLRGQDCPKCAIKKNTDNNRLTKEQFIEKARQVHGDKYDYGKVSYMNYSAKVCIICPEHGEFWQTPDSHLNGAGCPKCAGKFMNQEYFIEKSREIHGNKYDYSKVEYTNNYTKVCIICPEHGEFWQTPNGHLSGRGCAKCAGKFMNKEYFIEKSRKVHENKYDYSKVDYVNNRTKVCIICPKHGEFWQSPKKHLIGKGCPKCNMSHLERDVMQFLDRHNVEYEYQKRFEWLGFQSLDFYLPKYKIGIECQGIQHFEPLEYFGGEDEFKRIQERDKKKRQLCEEHNIRLKYYK